MNKTKNVLFHITVFLLLNTIIFKSMNFCLVDDTKSLSRLMIHEAYTSEENIDVLILGSSHTCKQLNPMIIGEIWKKNVFCAGTSAQLMDGSYYLLHELSELNDIEQCYLEISYILSGDVILERTDNTSTYIISDYLKPSIHKYLYILNSGPTSSWINGLFPCRRYSNNLFDLNVIKSNILKKTSPEYTNFEPITAGVETYVCKGYYKVDEEMDTSYFISQKHHDPITEKSISEDTKEYLIKIINECEDKGIELHVFATPSADFALVDIGNYDYYIEQVEEILQPYNVDFVDFTLCKNDYFRTDSTENFRNEDHLNYAGSTRFSRFFSNYYYQLPGYSECLYSSYSEKMKDIEGIVLGFIQNDEEGEREVVLVSAD